MRIRDTVNEDDRHKAILLRFFYGNQTIGLLARLSTRKNRAGIFNSIAELRKSKLLGLGLRMQSGRMMK
jgi:hypothetical protein